MKLKVFFSFYLFFFCSLVRSYGGGAVIASAIRAFRAVQTDGIWLDEFKPCGIMQDKTESYDICSHARRG